MAAEAVEGGSFEHFAVVRVGYGNHKAGPLLEGFAVEIHGAVFGDDPVGV